MLPVDSDGKASAYNEGDPNSILGSGRSPGEGNGNPLQYSCLENPMNRGAWQATVHVVTKSQTGLSDFTFTFSGGDGVPAYLFKVLKYNDVKVLHSICQQIWKTQQWPQDWKTSFFIPIVKKGKLKEFSNCHTIVLISHASNVMSKILQLGFNST